MVMKNRVDTLVIGAGPAGLSLAYHLQGNTLVLEKEDRVGGLCRSFYQHGGMFDIGGHSFHTPFPDVYELVGKIMQGRMDEFLRDARVFTRGMLIPYPFQKNFEQITDPKVVEECLAGLQKAQKTLTAQNYEEYILQRFGEGIAGHFMLPYNRKLWGPDLKRLSADWSAERVAGAKGENEKFHTSGGKRTPLQSDTHVAYPSRGGFVEIYKRMAEFVPSVKCDQTVLRIDPVEQFVETSSGEQVAWDRLVSTMPIPELLKVIQGVPQDLLELSSQLEYLPLRVELILVGRQMPDAPHRVYVADPAIPPHKIAFNHTSSRYLNGLPNHAIMAEVSVIQGKIVDYSTILPRTVDALIEMGLLKSHGEVVWNDAIEIKYGYPVYTHNRKNIVTKIKQYLQSIHIHTLGRFGEWEYINSDHCIWKGMQLAQHLSELG
jgi:UDP-galactopyranose mutase